MTLLRKIARVMLIVLACFLALSAVGGGVALVTGWYAPPVQDLGDSVFKDYTIPGLALVILVGGGALLSSILLIRRHPRALAVTAAAGFAVMFFEFVEILVIGSPAGPGRIMQIIYFGVGALMNALCIGLWLMGPSPRNP
jgi:hypothetical protein